MRTVLVVLIVGVARLALAAGRGPLGRGEAPRATDLLRAETLAEQAEKRLRLPARRSAGWARGGSGWSAEGKKVPRSEPVVIQVRPPRPRRSRGD